MSSAPLSCALVEPILELWRDAGRRVTMEVVGESMKPLIPAGGRVSLRLGRAPRLRRGDIALFRAGERFVVHRVLGTRGEGENRRFCQKGDHALSSSWVPGEMVLGRVESVSGPGVQLLLDRQPWRLFNRVLGTAGWCCQVLAGVLQRGAADGEGDAGGSRNRAVNGAPPLTLLLLQRLNRLLNRQLVLLGLSLSGRHSTQGF